MINIPEENTRVVPKKARVGGEKVPESIRAVIKVLNGPSIGTTFQITQSLTTIGRTGDVDIKIADDALSRCHAAITYHSMEFRIRDLDSANGTILNGSEVKEYALRNNDKVLVGETLLQFSIEQI